MGDASMQVEQALMNQYDLTVDVLKLGHHGSNTSSSMTFLDQLRPTVGLVSVGKRIIMDIHPVWSSVIAIR